MRITRLVVEFEDVERVYDEEMAKAALLIADRSALEVCKLQRILADWHTEDSCSVTLLIEDDKEIVQHVNAHAPAGA